MPGDTMNASASDAAVDAHRHAYNAAFHELGLGWYWDADQYRSVLCRDEENQRICTYLRTHQPHMLTAYDAAFLAEIIQVTQARFYDAFCALAHSVATPTDWAQLHQRQIGA